ncbi:Lrp/AsnC family transcriptional regulator [Candidatus Micrarchaeota archaeon]|nr:Lrp/AsnC family transcriptional regulator [Candidatus Micrarchaeota archaeon]
MHELDEKDYSILDVLKQNSALSMQKIAKKTGIPLATVHHRLKKLKVLGIIQKYTIILDKAKLGRKLVAYILLKAIPGADHTALLFELVKNPSIEDGSAVTGEFDLILKVRLSDIEELDQFVLKYLRTFKQIAQTQTMIAFKNIANP